MAKEYSVMAPKELSPLINDLKMSSPSDNRDAGFCSGEDEDLDADLNSPTDASEDSVDVKVHAIGGLRNNRDRDNVNKCSVIKRKCIEPRRDFDVEMTKKRRIQVKTEIKTEPDLKSRSPFRPWNHESSQVRTPPPPPPTQPQPQPQPQLQPEPHTIPQSVPCGYIPPSYRPQPPPPSTDQDEPLSLVVTNKPTSRSDWIYKPKYAGKLRRTDLPPNQETSTPPPPPHEPPRIPKLEPSSTPDFSLNLPSPQLRPPQIRIKTERRDEDNSIDEIRHINPAYREGIALAIKQEKEATELIQEPNPSITSPNNDSYESFLNPVASSSSSSTVAISPNKSKKACSSNKSSQSQQRNYKNMTRERRMEANARERTRVHTISAAFETLRQTVPAYSHNQKLSKLSVLRIACSYIMTLSRIAGEDYSADQSQPSVSSCVENVSKTIQMEGKLRKKKDDN